MAELLARDVTEHRLDNGLTVLLKEVHSAPVIACWAWYSVGSRNEQPGQTGISHWVEHMLFKGTPAWPKGRIMRAISRVGGDSNGFTSDDQTVYLATLPSEHIDLALDIEADRMVNAVFDAGEVESERTVIISEREGMENHPLALLAEQVRAAAFLVHSYHWPIVGWKCDLQVITRDEMFRHYRTFYSPNNCTLILVGDFESQDMLKRVTERFSQIVSNSAPAPVRSVEPPQEGERRLALRRTGTASYIHVAYHTPEATHEGIAALLLLDAILSGGKGVGVGGGSYLGRTSRLYRALVETRLATGVSSHVPLAVDPHLLTITATVRDGVGPAEVEAALLHELDRLADQPPEQEELAKAVRQARAQTAYSTDGVTGQAYALGLSHQLQSPRFLDELLRKAATVAPDDVCGVAQIYCKADNRTVGVFIPTGSAQQTPASE